MKFVLQKDPNSVRLYKWQHCALTQEPLQKPVVACELGRMYNKEAIIEKLLNAKSEGTSSDRDRVAEHIRNLKDVKELQLEPNPAFKGTYSCDSIISTFSIISTVCKIPK